MEIASHLLTVDQVAAHLQISKETVYRWLERGKIPAHRVGKQWRFQVSEIDDWVKRGEATENPRVGAESAEHDCSPTEGTL